MEDELKKKIKAIIAEAQEEDHHGNLLVYSDEATDSILSLLAPTLADAEKWRKVRKIFFDCSPCTGCTGCDIGSSESCKMVIRMNRFIGSDGVDALDREEEKG
jgi:hypothetical protein